MNLAIFISFLFNPTTATEIYTLSLHDALPIYVERALLHDHAVAPHFVGQPRQRDLHAVVDVEHRLVDIGAGLEGHGDRSEEHTSELQSRFDLVCRLLLEKKKKTTNNIYRSIKR